MVRLMTETASHECPGRDTLIQFDRCALPEARQEAVGEHVSRCERCGAILEEILQAGDSVLNGLRDCLNRPDPALGRAFLELEPLAGTLLFDPGHAERPRRDDETDLEVDEFRGKPFGPFEIGERIGKGGMGVVYKAWHVRLGRHEALKLILPGRAANPRTIERFKGEGQALARLKHPNIVQVFDSGEIDGIPYYSMELLAGENLRAKLKAEGGRLPPKEAALTVRTLALAMEYVHQQKIIHRDLKTSNVMAGDDGALTIVDFGLAKRIAEDPGVLETVGPTGDFEVLGTAPYISPEQAGFGSTKVTHATDVYSLGAILYELLTGRPPFQAATTQQVLQLVGGTAPTPPSRFRSEVPYGLESICLKCLEKTPAKRYGSARALADDLQCWLDGDRPDAVPTWPRRVARVARKRAGAIGIALLAALATPVVWRGATDFLNSPAIVAWGIQNRLRWGSPTVLIGPTGEPKWSRWLCGKPSRPPDLAPDGTFTLESWSASVLQLLPNPQCDRYRITAQVRHDKSEMDGRVGLFFAQSSYPYTPTDLQFHTRLTFNAVRAVEDVFERLPPEIRPKTPPKGNAVRLTVEGITDPALKPLTDLEALEIAGPQFKPLGEKNERWHDLEVVVTPTKIMARWNNSDWFSLDPSEAQARLDRSLIERPLRPPGDGLPAPAPRMNLRGGIGLYLLRGSASFRNVVVTPL